MRIVKPCLIYILGSGHSGSTMLQFLLAAHPGVVGLGEVFQPAGRTVDGSTSCSCGADFASCPVWAGTTPAGPGKTTEWYKDLAQRVAHLYPQATHWIDSSKLSTTIEPWTHLVQERVISGIRVLYLVRDVRGWVLSDQKARQRKAKSPRNAISSMKVWTREQKKTLDFLENSSLDFLVVSYESLIFNTRSMLEKIALFCGLTCQDHPWEDRLRSAEVHDIFGNRVKNDPQARGRLIYDDRWQYSLPVNLLACILPPVWKLNRELRTRGGL
jgi:hypothetical protein